LAVKRVVDVVISALEAQVRPRGTAKSQMRTLKFCTNLLHYLIESDLDNVADQLENVLKMCSPGAQ
jgi:hypothetical protein